MTFMRNGVWLTEIQLWEDAIRSSPHKSRCVAALGDVHRKKGDREGAKHFYEQAIRIDPTNVHALNHISAIYIDESAYDAAEHYALQAIVVEPENGKVLNTLGEIYMKRSDFTRALGYFFEALKKKTANPVNYYNAAVCLERLGRVEEACTYWRNYVRTGYWNDDIDEVAVHMRELGCSPQ